MSEEKRKQRKRNRAIAKTIGAIGLSLAALAALADGPIVFPDRGTSLAWDYEDGTDADEFRLYCQATSPVAPGEGILVAVVAAPTKEWTIANAARGQNYCVVTARDADVDVESGPSNEIAFVWVNLPIPGNLRVR